jgi:hypothetical protein
MVFNVTYNNITVISWQVDICIIRYIVNIVRTVEKYLA